MEAVKSRYLSASLIEKFNDNHHVSINNEVLSLLNEAKLFKCLLPEQLGGLGLSFTSCLQILHDAAYVNGSLGWLMQIANGGTYFLPLFNNEMQEAIFKPDQAVIAGSGAVSGNAIKTENGYLINGTWLYCSGADYATYFTMNVKNEAGEIISVAIPKADVNCCADWNSFGLANTSTHTIKVENVLVSEEQCFTIGCNQSTNTVQAFEIPFLPFAQLMFMQTVHGIYQRLLDTCLQFVTKRNEPTLRFNNALCLINNEQKKLVEYKRVMFDYALFTEHHKPTDEWIERVDIICKNQVQEIRNTALQLFTFCGLSITQNQQVYTTCFLDLLVVCQHSLLNQYHL